MSILYIPTLFHFDNYVNSIRCISIIASLVFFSPVQGFHMNSHFRESNETYDNKNKIHLRSKKILNYEPIFINDLLNESEDKGPNNIVNNNNGEKLYGKYPVCEGKYRIPDKIKVFKFLQKLLEKRKKVVLTEHCLTEMYELLFVTLKNTNDILLVLATVYGYVPYILILLIILGFFLTFSNSLLYFIFIITTQTTLNDLILKNVLKMRRPSNSALQSYGMPSGHSSFSLSILTFILLHLTESHKNKWNIIVSILVLITLFPVPWSRVYIEDHTLSQVIVGSILGVFIGYFFFIFKNIYSKYESI